MIRRLKNGTSADGRFSIDPVYRGATTARERRLSDYATGGGGTFDTVREAKVFAEKIIESEHAPYQPPSPHHRPPPIDALDRWLIAARNTFSRRMLWIERTFAHDPVAYAAEAALARRLLAQAEETDARLRAMDPPLTSRFSKYL